MVIGRHLSVLGKVMSEKCSFKKFFGGLLPYRYRNIIPIVTPYNCWKEFPYIYSEQTRVQVLQRCTSCGIIMDLRYKRKCKIRRFFVYNMIVEQLTRTQFNYVRKLNQAKAYIMGSNMVTNWYIVDDSYNFVLQLYQLR